MKEIIKVERKRILGIKTLIIILTAVLVFSIITTVDSLKSYDVFGSSGETAILSRDNLKESKQDKHNAVLDKSKMQEVVDRKDKSRFLYNHNLLRFLSYSYKDIKVEDLTEKDLDNYYIHRIDNIRESLSTSPIKHTKDQKEYLINKAEKMEIPLKIGYAEGWKNLNSSMVDFSILLVVLVSILILPMFVHDPKTKMRELYISTKHGKKTLIKCRLIAGFQVGLIIYGLGTGIFSLVKFIVYGIKGGSLPIQNSITYFLSVYNITYFQQYLINVILGFVAILFIVSIVFLFTSFVDQLLSGAVLVVFLWITMIIGNDNGMEHYLFNFLPYKLTDFNNYYINSEVYTIFGKHILSSIWVIVISFLVAIIMTSITKLRLEFKFSTKLK